MDTGEDIEEDTFSSGRRMMNWREERIKNLWIVERKGKRRNREDDPKVERSDNPENPEKRRKVEDRVEIQAEGPGKEVKDNNKDKVEVKSNLKEGQGTKIKGKNLQNNCLTNYFLVVDGKDDQQNRGYTSNPKDKGGWARGAWREPGSPPRC